MPDEVEALVIKRWAEYGLQQHASRLGTCGHHSKPGACGL
jgi:hypothetical protein